MEIPPYSKQLLCQSSSKRQPVKHERSCCIDVISTFTGHGTASLHVFVFAWPIQDKTVMTDKLHELLVRTASRAATPRLHLILLAAASYPSSQNSTAHGIRLGSLANQCSCCLFHVMKLSVLAWPYLATSFHPNASNTALLTRLSLCSLVVPVSKNFLGFWESSAAWSVRGWWMNLVENV